ncbi:MAG: hypothetical protein GAK41_01134 [Burkholderia gladioli]|nr:MAG: hypothetical protein GAK41_01134 [Burkholderia gladioli]
MVRIPILLLALLKFEWVKRAAGVRKPTSQNGIFPPLAPPPDGLVDFSGSRVRCAGLRPPLTRKNPPTRNSREAFYWYQLAWVFISAAITAFVYSKTKHCWRAGGTKEGGQ